MKNLYVLSSIFGSVNFSFEIDTIITDSKQNDVTVLVCDSCVGKCSGNTFGLGLLCSECKKRTNAVIESISGLKVIKMSDYYDNRIQHEKFNYSSLKELNRIEYKGFEIGYGVSSYYISLTRNLTPLITPSLKKILDNWLESSMKYADIADKVITTDYDMVYIVNGRLFDSKPFQEIAFNKGLHVILGESSRDMQGHYVRMDFDNFRVHSVKGNAERILSFWEESALSLPERKKVASSFFEKRANAIVTNDKVYTKDQQVGLMPDDWDNKKTNIGIFNSSEDEFAAIGGEWDKNKMFESQLSGIRFILQNTTDPNIHFYLRIHPNLMKIKYKYHTDLYKLPNEFNNITIIPGNSPISSYSLMRACDRIVTFGSTMGVEAAYAGKQAMVLLPCIYLYLNVNYVPQKRDDVISFIKGEINFTPNYDNILKYSYYYYNDERGGSINPECEIIVRDFKLFGKKLVRIGSMNLKCTERRMRYCGYLCLLGIFAAKYRLPRKEQ